MDGYPPGIIVGIDMAASKLAAVAMIPGRGYEEQPFEAKKKGDFDGPRRVFDLADNITRWCSRVHAPAYYFIEDTRFSVSKQALGNANSGELRGVIYERLRAQAISNFGAWLVSPSRWRSFHDCKATRDAKQAEYYDVASELGFVSECSIKKQREDCTSAFLIAYYGAACLGLISELTTKQTDMASRIVNDPTVRIA